MPEPRARRPRVRRGYVLTESEEAFQQKVIGLAGFNGFELIYHTKDSRGSRRGFPDLVLARRPELIIAELKGPKTRVTPEQLLWLAELKAIGEAIAYEVEATEQSGHLSTVPRNGPRPSVQAYLWRAGVEEDWQEIERVLRRP